MADEFGEKTEQPTERRRQRAREQGNVARSVDLTNAGVMLAGVAALLFLGGGLAGALAELLRGSLSRPGWNRLDLPFLLVQIRGIATYLAASVLPFLLVSFMAAILVNLVQVGFLFAPEVVQPKLSRLNPWEGVKRIVSMRSVVKLLVSLGKLGVLTAVAAAWIVWQLPMFSALSAAEPAVIAVATGRSLAGLAGLLTLALLMLAALDYGFQKWKYERDLRMTRQEVREELKEMEGDPHIRQRRREAHRKLTLARELSAVKTADVVITNPTEIAVAIRYDPERMPAPTVVAKGMGEIAARIRQVAIEHRVPIIERKPLARALYRNVKVGQPVPVEMYAVLAEIMAYVYRLTGRAAA